MVWLAVMTLFPLSLLLLKFNRGRLPRKRSAPLFVIIAALGIAGIIFAGNIYINPITVGSVLLDPYPFWSSLLTALPAVTLQRISLEYLLYSR
jgi:hypothetical protein